MPQLDSDCNQLSDVSNKEKTVLLVDDDDQIREVLHEILETVGYSVLSASSSQEAINLFVTNKDAIDLLLFDLSLQGVDGVELAKRLVTQNSKLKVLIISGNQHWFLAKTAMLKSRFAFMEKPFDFSQLVEKTQELIGVH